MTPLRRTVALRLSNASVRAALDAVARLSGMTIAYGEDVLRSPVRVTLRVDGLPVIDALTAILDGTGLDAFVSIRGDALLVQPASMVGGLQAGTVLGQIKDAETGAGIRDAEVYLNKTRWRTTTDSTGRYHLDEVEVGTYMLVVRKFGYLKQSRSTTIAAERVDTIDLVLKPSPRKLDELVTTATGDQRRRDIGNAVTTIAADSTLRTAPIKSLTELLDGRVPGLTAQHSSGAPGDPTRLRLRGLSTLYRSNDMIVIVDGVRIYAAQADVRSGNLATGGAAPSPIDQIDVNSIEKVEIFKGPSAATLYGADATNGVLVVTTKRGKPGPTRWNGNVTYGRTRSAGEYPDGLFRWGHPYTQENSLILCPVIQLTCVQDSLVRYQALNDPAATMFGTGHDLSASLTASGGNQVLTYSLTGSYGHTVGLLTLPAFEATRFRALTGKEPADWMRRPHELNTWSMNSAFTARVSANADVTLTTTVSRSEQQRSSLEGEVTSFAQTYIDKVNGLYYRPAPTADLSGGIGGFGAPPLGGLFTSNSGIANNYFTKTTASAIAFTATLGGDWRPRRWLTGRATTGVNVIPRNDMSLIPPGMQVLDPSLNRLGASSRGIGRSVVGDFHLNGQILAPMRWGFDFQMNAGMDVTSTLTDDARTVTVGRTLSSTELVTTATGETFSASSFGWYIEPTFKHRRFTVSTGLRLDGGSTYGAKVKFAGGAGAGGGGVSGFLGNLLPKLNGSWLISDEPFFPFKGVVSSLRLRGAFGRSITQPGVGDRFRTYREQQAILTGAADPTAIIENLGNTALRPERSQEFEGGFDADLFDSRVMIELTGYRKTQYDALMNVPLPPSVYGGGTIFKNIGVIRNTGVEFTAGLIPLRSLAVTWSTQLHVAWNRNVVVKLAPGVEPFFIGDTNNLVRIVPGYPIGGRWARPIVGYADANGNGALQADEVELGDSLAFLGNLLPSPTSTLFTNFSFLNGMVGLSASVSYEAGATQVDRSGSWVFSRPLADVSAPFSEVAAVLARYSKGTKGTEYGLIQDISTFRFNSLSLNYRMPDRIARLVGAERLAFSLQGSNLGLHSTYRGKDPDVNVWAPGESVIDTGQLAIPRLWQVRFDVVY